MAYRRWIVFVVVIVLISCTAGCVQMSQEQKPYLKTYGTPFDIESGAEFMDWLDSPHTSASSRRLQEYMDGQLYPNGTVLGWAYEYYFPTECFTLLLYVSAAPTDAKMDEMYAMWNSSAADAGVSVFSGIPLTFVLLPVDDEDVPLHILCMNPAKDTEWYGDVVPHKIVVKAFVLSEYGIASSQVTSLNTTTWQPEFVPFSLKGFYGVETVYSRSGTTSVTIRATDVRGNTAEETVNYTLHTGMPPPKWSL